MRTKFRIQYDTKLIILIKLLKKEKANQNKLFIPHVPINVSFRRKHKQEIPRKWRLLVNV